MNCLTKTIFSFSLVALTISARANDKSAPNFAMPASDGHSYTLRTLGNGKPLLLMFFAAGCEHTPSGISDLNRLQTLFGSKVQIAGMVNLDPRQTKLLAVQHHARFPILSDQMAETIGA